MTNEKERVLGRMLAVEEMDTVSGAVTSPGSDGQTDPGADAGTGCTGLDDPLLPDFTKQL